MTDLPTEAKLTPGLSSQLSAPNVADPNFPSRPFCPRTQRTHTFNTATMCIKTIFHNQYLDGEEVTERVETCTPGYLCANPKTREVDRKFNYPKMAARSSPDRRASTYYAEDRHIRPPSPLTRPGSRGSDTERRRKPTGFYFDGNKLVEVRHDRSPRRHRAERPVVLEPKQRVQPPHAPEPPAPRAIPIMKRASTMPYGMETPPEVPMRGRRPIIVEERVSTPARKASDGAPLAPVEVVEHATSGRLQRRPTRRDSDLLYPTRRRERSPQGYGSAEDDTERRDRRQRRRQARAQAAGMATSVPTFGNTDVYGSSPSSYGSSSPSSPIIGPSPAVSAVKKELRWEDQQRAVQNARIDARPKLSRSATANANAATQGEVKSILKNASGGASPVMEPQKQQSSRRSSAAFADDELADLYRSVEEMNLQERETSSERRSRLAEEKDSAAYMDRLRNRFSMPPRRFTAGQGVRRRTEIWYPDEGRYKYL